MPDEREWYEIAEDARTPAQSQQAWECYYNSLLADPHGRAMVCDFRRRVKNRIRGCAKTPELAVAQIWLEAFIDDSLTLAGVTDDASVILAMATLGRSWKPPKAKKPFRAKGYAE